MIDLKWVRNNRDIFDVSLQKRNIKLDVDALLELDKDIIHLQSTVDELIHLRNQISKKIALVDSVARKNYQNELDVLKFKISDKSEELNALREKLKAILVTIPNILHEDVPFGNSDDMDHDIFYHKHDERRLFGKEHFDLAKELNMIDFEQTSVMSGSRFVTLKNDLAALERAIKNYMCDVHVDKFGFEEITTPVIVNKEALYNSGHLPKFEEDLYKLDNKKQYLIPTSEVTLVNMYANKILQYEDLPIRHVSYTNCFRSEAGSAGRDTKGMIRNHQFSKVELVSITTPENSQEEHEYILNAAKFIIESLEIPYRVLLLCSGNTGFHSSKTYDIEAWFPGQQKYREISSVSNCLNFQSMRLRTRYKDTNISKNILLHTLNGSGLAVGRVLAAILENYQNADGSISIPKVLVQYMKGKTEIVSKR